MDTWSHTFLQNLGLSFLSFIQKLLVKSQLAFSVVRGNWARQHFFISHVHLNIQLPLIELWLHPQTHQIEVLSFYFLTTNFVHVSLLTLVSSSLASFFCFYIARRGIYQKYQLNQVLFLIKKDPLLTCCMNNDTQFPDRGLEGLSSYSYFHHLYSFPLQPSYIAFFFCVLI